MTDDLMTAVHRLTRETRTKVIQDGDGQQTVAIVIHKPLLTQLNEAVTSAIGSGGGGGTATGSMLNDAAFGEVFKIRPAIESWCRAAGVPVTRDMAKDLDAWVEAYTGDAAESHLRHVLAWETKITNLLDPPNRLEVTEPCPVCLADEFEDADGNALKFPIVIEFRRDRPGEARGLCRACDKLWTGVLGLRELRWMTDDNERKEVG